MSDTIEPSPIHIPESALVDLRERLARTRWPEPEPVDDWSQGVPRAKLQALCDYWRTGYDWRRCEGILNGWGSYRTVIDGLAIHFFHVRSPEPDALPLIITHGWPGSVIEFHKVVGPLTNPAAHGGDRRDAFHLVLPMLPGYGFSDRPAATGWTVDKTADAWIELMRRLGYGDRWAAQGGDWGAAVTRQIGLKKPAGCVGIHLNMMMLVPTPEEVAAATPEEQGILKDLGRYQKDSSGYAKEQTTRPQTLGYALADSPAGQAAWIYEKFHEWTDPGTEPEAVLTHDELLDNLMLYWLPNTAAASARLYWESMTASMNNEVCTLATGLSVFPKEIMRASRRWAAKRFPNVTHFGKPERGGHFAAFEQPGLFADEVRAGLRPVR